MSSFFQKAQTFLGVGGKNGAAEGVPPPNMSQKDQIALLLKQTLIFLGVMRVLTLGFLGNLGTAGIASGLGFGARKYPQFVPKQVKGMLVYVDRLHTNKWGKLALCGVIDSLSATMHFLPGWAYWLLGEAGFQPANVFLVQYMFQKPWLTGLNVFEHSIPFLNFFPTATVGWLFEYRILKEEWVTSTIDFVQKVRGKKPIPGEQAALKKH